jgi:HSP20 family protein
MASSITRFNPLQDLVSMQRELDRLWTGFSPFGMGSEQGEPSVVMPSIDITSRGEDMVIRADIPGVKPENVDITVNDSSLTLKAQREEHKETNQESYVVRERSWGSYQRTMRLPRGVDANSIRAEFHDGVLEIVVPHAAQETERTAVHVPIRGTQGQQ